MDVETRTVDVQITDAEGEIVFEKKDFEVPRGWSDRAATIMASKYAMDYENSAIDIIRRVTHQISRWGLEQEYFEPLFDLKEGMVTSDPKDSDAAFEVKLFDILVNQRAAFNSPVWFNVGVKENNNQCSACFILPLEDTMESILGHTVTEGEIFRHGSGTGINISKLRAKGEALSNRGKASGPISFMKGHDAFAGVIKSGGKTRRAAKLVCMDVDHPDIEEFIECKLEEEKKARILMGSGYSAEDAYNTVAFQNANHSIRVTDEFMEAVEEPSGWTLWNRGDEEEAETLPAMDILGRAAEAAWEIGDPGIQYHDRMNKDNPVPSLGEIRSTNPCLTADMELLTPEGYKPIGDLAGGEHLIINKDNKIVRSKIWSTGVKPVCEVKFHWKLGLEPIRCTPDHIWMLADGSECETRHLKNKRLMPQEFFLPMNQNREVDKHAFLAGFVQGDGNAGRLSSDPHKGLEVYFGRDDKDVANIYNQPVGKWYSNWAYTAAQEFGISAAPLPFRTLPDQVIDNPLVDMNRDFISGLYTANGCIVDGARVALKTTCLGLAKGLQYCLEAYGIESYITTNKAHRVAFSNGEYECRESYDINIHRYSSLVKFFHTFYFGQKYKRDAMKELLLQRAPIVSSVRNTGEEEVFDFNEPETHWGIVNGFICHNCSEFAAVDNSSCNLASLNLVKYWDPQGKQFDWDLFQDDIHVIVTAMDILVEAADYPSNNIREMTVKTRPLGLGFSNLGALLVRMGVPYASRKGREIATSLTQNMTAYAYEKSIELAERLGSFEVFEDNKARCIEIAERVSGARYIGQRVAAKGLRNSQLTLLAPTGTISFMMDCDSTGIEPLFALEATKTLAGGGTMNIIPSCVEYARQKYGFSDDDPVLKTANEISWKDHIFMMAACQKHLNGAISKTVNMPSDCTATEIEEAYKMAWRYGIKALAVYRDGTKENQPLVSAKEEKISEEEPVEEQTTWSAFRRKVPDTSNSVSHKFNIGGFKGYFTVSLYEDGMPGGLFINMQKQGSTINGLMDSFAVLVSFALQYGVPLEKLYHKFKDTRFEPAGVTKNPDIPIAKSLMDYIFRWMAIRFLEIDEERDSIPASLMSPGSELQMEEVPTVDASGPICTECGQPTVLAGRCYLCTSCGAQGGCS